MIAIAEHGLHLARKLQLPSCRDHRDEVGIINFLWQTGIDI
jgi:hypothetical protein